MRNRSKCWWTSQHAGGPETRELGLTDSGIIHLPPNPVANPTLPSVASISTQKDPKTLMPQLVLEARYFSHRDIGVDMGVSINLRVRCQHQQLDLQLDLQLDSCEILPVAALDIVVISSRSNPVDNKGPDGLD
jgi:hypothetical protein